MSTSSTEFEIVENTTLVGTVVAQDLDGDDIAFGIVAGEGDDTFTIDPATGALSFIDAPDFETDPRSYSVTVTATTADGQADTRQITVTVADDPELAQPTIDQVLAQAELGDISSGLAVAATFPRDSSGNPEGDPGSLKDGQALDQFGLRAGYTGDGYLDFNGNGSDSERADFTFDVPTAGAYDLTIRYASTGSAVRPLDIQVGGETQVAGQGFPGAGFNNWVTLTVQLSLEIGENIVTLAIPAGASNGPNVDALVLTSVGEAADFFPPVFDAEIGDLIVAENSADFSVSVTATDTSDTPDDVTYSLSGDDADDFDIDDAGTLTFAATPDFEAPTDADGDNLYAVTIAATAGGTTERQELSVTVTDVDDVATVLTLEPVDVTEKQPGAVLATIIATDPDTDLSGLTINGVTLSDNGTFRVIEEDGVLKLALAAGVELDFEADLQPSVTVTVNGTTADFTPVPQNDRTDDPATATVTLQGVAFDENTVNNVVAEIVIANDDTAYTTESFTLTGDDAGRFAVIGDATSGFQLVLAEALDLEAGDFPSVAVSVGDVSSEVFTATPTNVNEAPTLSDGASLTDVTAAFGAGASVDLRSLAASDPDGDDTTYGVRAVGAATPPAGITIVDTDLVVAGDTAPGTYVIEVFANDGNMDSESVSLTVTVNEAVAFAPFSVQAEDGVITLAQSADTSSTQVRDADNMEGSGDDARLRPDFSGTGYVDYGNDTGDRLTLTVSVPTAGDYDLNVRYASNSDRPLDLAINGVIAATPMAFASTDPDGPGSATVEGFDNWLFETRTVALTGGENTIAFVSRNNTGPNIDRIEITEAGSGPIPVEDGSADEDGDLAVAGPDTVLQDALGAVDVTLNGVDADIVTYEVSLDGGAFETVIPNADTQTITLDLSAFATADSVPVTVRLTDDAGNFVTTGLSVDIDSAPTALGGDASTQAGQAVVIALADLIADAEDGEPTILSATSPDGTVAIDAEALTLTFTPNSGVSGPATISYTVQDSAGQQSSAEIAVTVGGAAEPTITLSRLAFDENVAAAVVADIIITDANPEAGDLSVDDDNFQIIGTPGALRLALADGVALDFEAGGFPSVTVSFGAVSPDVFTATPDNADDPAIITLTPLEFAENVDGATVASIIVTDQDGDTYTAGQFTVDDFRFEVVEENGLKLKLKSGQSLDAEGAIPTLTIGVGSGSAQFVPSPGDVAEPSAITFSTGAISAYNNQDKPVQGGSVTFGDGGNAITLDGNFWKRAAIDPVTITESTVLRVTIATPILGEIVGIGFDADGDAFDSDRNLYQLAGTQRFTPFVNLAGTGTDNSDGTTTFEIPLGAQSGQTFSSLVLINDDDNFGNGRGSVTFSGVEIAEAVVVGGNQAPRVVGGGVTDVTTDEGARVEIDLPFVDDDNDPIAFSYAATLGGEAAILPLTIEAGTLVGDLGDTAPGIYTITVTADDDNGGVTTDTFTLTVENVNEAPVADQTAAFEPFFGAVGQEIAPIDLSQFTGAFTDPDGDTLDFVVTGLPAGLQVQEGVIFGTPTASGDGTFTITARDPGGLTSVEIEIQLQIDAPGIGDVFAIEAENFTGLATATNFFKTGQAGASGDQLIRLNGGQTGSVTSKLADNGPAKAGTVSRSTSTTRPTAPRPIRCPSATPNCRRPGQPSTIRVSSPIPARRAVVPGRSAIARRSASTRSCSSTPIRS